MTVCIKRHFFISVASLASLSCSMNLPKPDSAIAAHSPEYHSSVKQQENSKNTTLLKSAAQLTHWKITGAIAAKRNKKAWSASISWKQFNTHDYQIHLFGPLGGGNILLDKKGGVLTYQDGEKIKKSTNEQALLYQETGTKLPLNQLYYWVRGQKAPGEITQAQYDAAGHLTTFHQAGYTIQYTNYKQFNQYELPTKIRIDNAEGFVKLAINQWNIDV